MTRKDYFSKFQFAEKFERLPLMIQMGDPCSQYSPKGILDLSQTKVDMIPEGLKGINSVYFDTKPDYIAPDYNGKIYFYDCNSFTEMSPEEVAIAKSQFVENRFFVEKARYLVDKDGLSYLCSLPQNMTFIEKKYTYYLNLTRTDVIENPGIYGVISILYPKYKSLYELKVPEKNSHHNSAKIPYQNPRIKE